jgi:DNA-binding beta-propeller fold protein YncE
VRRRLRVRRRRLQTLALAAGLLLAFLAGASGPVGASTQPLTLYVTNFVGASVVPVVPSTGRAGPAITVGDVPTDVAIAEDGATAYVTASYSSAVVPVDLDTSTAGAPISVPCPVNIALGPGQATAYVSQPCANTITPINLSTNTAGTPIEVGPGPYDVTIAPDGATAYVTTLGDESTPGALTPVDVATGSVGAPIPLGTFRYPASVVVTPDGTTAFVAVQEDQTVVPVDLASWTLGAPIPVAQDPMGLAVTPGGETLYVTHFPLGPDGLGDPDDARDVTPIDIATRTALPQIAIGPHTYGIAVTADGATAFVTSSGDPARPGEGVVVPIDVATNVAGAPIVLAGDPGAVAIRPSFSDTTPPTVELETTPATPTGGAGAWFNGADLGSRTLVVSANASDEGSGVASLTCVVNGETRSVNGSRLVIQDLGEGVHTVSCTGEDVAGNVSDPPVSATYRVDTVAPTLQPTVSGSGLGGTALLQDSAAAADAGAEDSGSGVTTEACGALDVSSVGVHEVSCSATDVAGNTRTAKVSYVVRYALVGLSPEEGTTARAGRPLQIRISLADADGSLQAPCEGCTVHFQAFAVGGSGQNAGPFEMRYHAASQQLRTSWKPSASGTGPTRITVTVRYPGTMLTTTLSAQITLT